MANEAKIVCVATYNVTSRDIERVVRQAAHLLQDTAPTLEGFIEGVVLTTEDQTQVILLTNWESRDAWARGEWNEQISRGVAELYKETASFTIKLFHEVAQAKRAAAAPTGPPSAQPP